jgi:hypothetical protein
MSIVEKLRASCVLVQSPASQGTAYFVQPRTLATCHHVVESAGVGNSVKVLLAGRTVDAKVTKLDKVTDCAILEIAEPVPGTEPLPLARQSHQKAQWDGYGFPALIKGAGVPFFGIVLDPASSDDLERPMVTLYSEMVAAGMAAPINGLSGGPVIVDGAVIGHFSRVVGTPGEAGKPALGVVYAARAANVLELLGVQPDIAVASVRTPPGLAKQVPSIGADEYHAFISYRSTDRQFALRLYERLDAIGFKVFLDQRELVVGDNLATKLHTALGKSRCGIVLVSKSWLESPWCREEGDRIAHRAIQEHDRFRVIPIKLDTSPMPDIFQNRLHVDFAGQAVPSGRNLEQIIYAVLGKPTPAPESGEAKFQATVTDATDEMLARAETILRDPTRLRELLDFTQKCGLPEVALKLRVGNALIDAGWSTQALEVLPAPQDSTRALQLRALALSRDGRHPEARALLEPLFERGEIDAETGGILGGIYKRVWQQTGDPTFLIKSLATYQETFSRAADSYVGINVAAMLLLRDKPAEAKATAHKVLELLGGKPAGELSEWDLATIGEAYLILEDLASAASWYEKAVARAFTRPASIAAMRRQARLLLRKQNRGVDALDASLPVPKVVAFSGHLTDAPGRAIPRFPENKQAAVRRELEKWVRANGGRVHAVCSAARGGDLLFLEVVLANEGTATVLLPFPPAAFKQVSVGQGWDKRFDAVLGNARVDERKPLFNELAPANEQPAAFERCNDAIIEEAVKLAKAFDDAEPVLLTVWNRSPGEQGGTASMVAAWLDRGNRHENVEVKSA